MNKIHIVTDSASDIPVEAEKKYSITVIPIPITIGGCTYLSRVDLTNEQFYDMLANCDEIPKTAQITPFQYQEVYLHFARMGVRDLIHVGINSKASNCYSNSLLAIKMFYDEHPEYRDSFRIHSVDGMGYCAMYGSPVIHAAEMAENGAEVEEILAYLHDILPRQRAYFGVYDLKYAARSGRIPTAAAFIGNKLNLKPILRISGSEIVTAAKCRGGRSLIDKLIKIAETEMEPGAPYEIGYGSDAESFDELHRRIVERLGYEPSAIYQIGAVIVTNSGPQILGVMFRQP